MRIEKSDICKLLEGVQNDCWLLISDIHQSYVKSEAEN